MEASLARFAAIKQSQALIESAIRASTIAGREELLINVAAHFDDYDRLRDAKLQHDNVLAELTCLRAEAESLRCALADSHQARIDLIDELEISGDETDKWIGKTRELEADLAELAAERESERRDHAERDEEVRRALADVKSELAYGIDKAHDLAVAVDELKVELGEVRALLAEAERLLAESYGWRRRARSRTTT